MPSYAQQMIIQIMRVILTYKFDTPAIVSHFYIALKRSILLL